MDATYDGAAGRRDEAVARLIAKLGGRSLAIRERRTLVTSESGGTVERPQMLGDRCALPFRRGAFRVVTAEGTLDRGTTDEMRAAIEEIRRVLEPGGALWCNLLSVSDAQYGRGVALESGTFQVSAWHEVVHFSSYEELLALFGGWDCLELREREVSPAAGGAKDSDALVVWEMLLRQPT